MASDETIYSATQVMQCAANVGELRAPVPPKTPRRRFVMSSSQAALWSYHWLLWMFLVGLQAAQFSCVFWDSSNRFESIALGQPPSIGPHALSADGVDPEPYADRMLLCVLNGGRQYQLLQLSEALSRSTTTEVEDPHGTQGYRIVHRTGQVVEICSETMAHYTPVCDQMAWTLDAILDSCMVLGYNSTSDYARVVDGLGDLAEIKGIIDSLPVLIEPLSDNGFVARYIVPSHDGSACIFRLLGKYETPTATSSMIFRGVTKKLYEQRTMELLNVSTSGMWKNGWYTTPAGTKWHSEVMSTASDSSTDSYGVVSRVFDTENNRELPANTTTSWAVERTWGSVASASDSLLWFHSLTISNGSAFGIYRNESSQTHLLRSKYTLETFIVNLSIFWVLFRWALCMVSLQRNYSRGCPAPWQAASLGGAVACMRSFHLLPLILLVRLKATLAAFWTVGCALSGEQRSVSEAWFVVYPAIAELTFFNFSMLNMAAKMLRRRVSDSLFGPTIAFFCLLHLFREVAFPELIPTLVSSATLESLSLPKMLMASVTLRLNGNVSWLYQLKISVLVMNWLPLFAFSDLNIAIYKRSQAPLGCRVEKALALRVSNLGGFGISCVYSMETIEPTPSNSVNEKKPAVPRTFIVPFELLRMGYVVLGDRFVVSFNDWFLLLVLTPWRRRTFPPNFRVVAFAIEHDSDGCRVVSIGRHPEMFRLNDPRLMPIDIFDVSSRSMY